jgi:hypothetical protein
MRTASFFTFAGAGRIAISRSVPRNAPAGFRVFRALAPGPWFASVTRPEYERLYAEQLAALDAKNVWDALHALAGGSEPVLQCYERPPFTQTNWCHRRLAAAWFETELGVIVSEWSVETRAEPAIGQLNLL